MSRQRQITSLLANGDHEAVLVASDAKFGNLWKAIAYQIISPNKRRASDLEDVCQETLTELHRVLASGSAAFVDSDDIRRWSAQVAKYKSLQAVGKAKRTRGPSSIDKIGDGSEPPAGQLSQVLSEETGPEQLAIIQEAAVLEKQLVDGISEFSDEIDLAINGCCEKEKTVVTLFLDGKGIHTVANEASTSLGERVSDHFVKTTTYAFTHDTFGERVNALRSLFMAIENSAPGVATRISIPKWVARCLTDFRKKPY